MYISLTFINIFLHKKFILRIKNQTTLPISRHILELLSISIRTTSDLLHIIRFSKIKTRPSSISIPLHHISFFFSISLFPILFFYTKSTLRVSQSLLICFFLWLSFSIIVLKKTQTQNKKKKLLLFKKTSQECSIKADELKPHRILSKFLALNNTSKKCG